MNIQDSIRVPITNHLAGRTYYLVNAGGLEPTTATLQCITAICNEPAVYDWLFRGTLHGEPYPEQKAREFLAWAKSGWDARAHFVFAVIDAEGTVVAACDIKSTDPVPEIGYWSSQHHPGIMTNAVRAMVTFAADAGFAGLFARARISNTKSLAVLQRVGFNRITSDDPERYYFEMHLNPLAF